MNWQRWMALGLRLTFLVGSVESLFGQADPSTRPLFPIGVWLQNPTNAPAYRAAGINTFIGLWQGPTESQLTSLQQAEMRVICRQNEIALQHPAATNIIAWMHDDEPDNARGRGARLGFGSPIAPARIQSDYRALKQRDPRRPVFLSLGQGVAWDGWYGRGRRNNHPEDYAEYVQGADLVAFNVYPVNHDSPEIAGNLWYVPAGIQRLRAWSKDEKPVWNCIETTQIHSIGRKPTTAEVRAQVWMSLIHDSQGIIYFAHQFEPQFVEAALLADKQMLAAVTQLNQEITRLAPMLATPSLPDLVTLQTDNAAVPIAFMIKRQGDAVYLFAVAMRPGKVAVNFAFTNADELSAVEVIGENRSLAVQNNTFADKFGPWEVHLYRLETAPKR